MEIEVDYNPSPSRTFFVSVGLNETEAISFDYTTKGHRIIKQVLVKKGKATALEKKGKPTAEWDAIVLHDTRFVKKYHVVWYDRNKEDLVNDELWKIVWEKPMPTQLRNQLLKYSQLISDNYERLDKFSDTLKEFENLLSKEIMNCS